MPCMPYTSSLRSVNCSPTPTSSLAYAPNSSSKHDEASSKSPVLFSPTPTCNITVNKWLSPPPLPQRSPHIRRRHNLHNYTSLVPTNGRCDVHSSVGALPPDTPLPQVYGQWTIEDSENWVFANRLRRRRVCQHRFPGLSISKIQGTLSSWRFQMLHSSSRQIQCYHRTNMTPLIIFLRIIERNVAHGCHTELASFNLLIFTKGEECLTSGQNHKSLINKCREIQKALRKEPTEKALKKVWWCPCCL